MTTTYSNNFDHTKPFSDTCFQANLATNTQQTFTVPGTNIQKYRAIFGIAANANIYIGLNVTATAPGAGLNTSTGNLEFRPIEPKYVKGGDVLSFITSDAAGAYVGVSLLGLPA
jgi:hypothetical protein